MPTYQTRHMTARDNLLVDRLAADPRYAKIAERLRPSLPVPKAKAKAAPKVEPVEEAQDEPAKVGKPKPKTPAR